jgi:hypothetical protein
VLYAGWVLTSLVKAGLPVTPVYDSDGIVTNRVLIDVPEDVTGPGGVVLMIPPPPDGWKLPL